MPIAQNKGPRYYYNTTVNITQTSGLQKINFQHNGENRFIKRFGIFCFFLSSLCPIIWDRLSLYGIARKFCSGVLIGVCFEVHINDCHPRVPWSARSLCWTHMKYFSSHVTKRSPLITVVSVSRACEKFYSTLKLDFPFF